MMPSGNTFISGPWNYLFISSACFTTHTTQFRIDEKKTMALNMLGNKNMVCQIG